MKTVNNVACLAAALSLISATAFAAKPCDELKSEIDAKLQSKGVKDYTLDVVAADAVKDQKVIGSCEAGSKKIVYSHGAPAASPSPTPAP